MGVGLPMVSVNRPIMLWNWQVVDRPPFHHVEKRACERLRAVKHEIEHNELIEGLFGIQIGKTWNEAEVILANGVRIIAVGRGQSLRGTKHLHYRPDFAFADDIEDKEHIVTPDAREETQKWFLEEFMPCLDKAARIRMNATPLDRDSLPMRIQRWGTWKTVTYPIESVSPEGVRVPTWPSRYPLSWIDSLRKQYETAGDIEGYLREYMCIAEDPARKIFTAGMFKVKPRVRTWEPVYAVYDPARTTNKTSATTGYAVFSWIGNRLVVWDAGGEFWKPDEIIDHIFKVVDEYSPVSVGVEEDGLNEFILQPLRHEQLRRNMLVNVAAQKAPKGKISFISGMQPHFNAGEVTFAKDLPELVRQFLSFPTGRIDAPNALAYALKMRPGAVVFDGFSHLNAAEDLAVRPHAPVYLCLNAAHGYTAGAAAQTVDGCLHVLGDYVREGPPGEHLRPLVIEAQAAFGTVRLLAPPAHWGAYDRIGLRGAAAALPAELRPAGDPSAGREELRTLFQRQYRGFPAVRVSPAARWTLNGLAAGYAYEVDKRGRLSSEPAPNVYRTLIEGLEAFTGLMKIGMREERLNVRTTEGGQRYVSALPGLPAAVDKGSFLSGAVADAPLSARR